eukprot:GHVP01064817.1.p1 GENE.GHVP01064817.1~~GHVP01064817.1.p1  ORF type:complete len:182 (+),score=26.34 GHVP01064817.1:57-602(+)
MTLEVRLFKLSEDINSAFVQTVGYPLEEDELRERNLSTTEVSFHMEQPERERSSTEDTIKAESESSPELTGSMDTLAEGNSDAYVSKQKEKKTVETKSYAKATIASMQKEKETTKTIKTDSYTFFSKSKEGLVYCLPTITKEQVPKVTCPLHQKDTPRKGTPRKGTSIAFGRAVTAKPAEV